MQLTSGVGGTLAVGVVHYIYESAVVVAVGGEMLRYLPCDLQPIKNVSSVLRGVCDRVMSLWKVLELPASVQCLLEVFYQRRLEFEQGDLGIVSGKSVLLYQLGATQR